VVIPFFTFRIMVGMGLIMLAISWFGLFLWWRGELEASRWFLWTAFLSFPTGFVAIITGWYTAEVGRQPWIVYGLMRTSEGITPSLTAQTALLSLVCYVVVYLTVFSFGAFYIYKLLREGPHEELAKPRGATPSRPMAFADSATTTGGDVRPGE
jgi:cytochrome d ubiquinol oxidase subunit I